MSSRSRSPKCLATAGSVLSISIGLLGPGSGANAQEWQAGGAATVAGQFVSNPFLDAGDSKSTAAVQADVRPFVRFTDGSTQIRFDAYANVVQYAKAYGLEDNYGASVRLRRRMSSTIDVNSSVRFDYIEARLGSLNLVPTGGGEVPGPGPALPPIEPTIPDVTLLGARARAKSGEASLGMGIQLNERNRIEGDLGARGQWFESPRFDDYESYSGELRFSHVIDSRFSVGVVGGIAQTDYDGDVLRKGRSTFALLSTNMKIGSRWTANLAAGMSFSRVTGAPGQPSSKFNAFSVRGNLCRSTEREKLCLNVRRWPQPTALGGVRTSDSAMVTYDRRLSERDRILASASYLRTSQGRGPVLGFTRIEFMGATARYERTFSPRFLGFIQATGGKLRQSGFHRDPSASISAGITFRFGSLR